jgi:membrane protease YdiL (CAAX protease family)
MNIPPIVPMPPVYGADQMEFEMPSEPELPRKFGGWIVLAIIFLALIAIATTEAEKKTNEFDTKKFDKTVELTLSLPQGTKAKKAIFVDEIDRLQVESKRNPYAQKLRVALRVEDGDLPFGDDLKNLAGSKKDENKAFAALYATPPPDKKEAEELIKKLDGDEVSEKLAKVQLAENNGDKKIRSRTFAVEKATGFLIVIWTIYFNSRATGRLKIKGFSMGSIDLGRADRLAIMASMLMCGYLFASVLLGYGGSLIPKQFQYLLPLPEFVILMGVVALVLKMDIAGFRVGVQRLGLSLENFWFKLAWGVGAAIANIPVMMFVLLLTSALTKILPGGSHPITDELINTKEPLQIAMLFFGASIMAPIWEEIMFRGLLFPALAKVLGGPVRGAIASSFMFAAIHPQGPAGIIPIMAIGLMTCAITYHTKSLIPNMIFHCVHNSGLLVLTIFTARSGMI